MRRANAERPADRAGRDWDAFVRAGHAAAIAPDAEFTATIFRLHAGDDAPAVDPTFSARLYARLVPESSGLPAASVARSRKDHSMAQADVVIPGRILNRHRRAAERTHPRPAVGGQREYPGTPRGVRAWIGFTALLIVIAVSVGMMSFGLSPYLFDGGNDNAFIPAAGSPASVVAPEPDVAELALAGQHRGNAARTGVYPGAGPSASPERQWVQEMPGARINPSLVVDAGRVFLLKSPLNEGESPHLWAFDLDTGDQLWTFSVNWTNNRLLAAANGLVFVSRGGEAGEQLVALDAATGAEIWAYSVGYTYVSSPAIYEDTVVVTGGDNILRAVDVATGTERWRFELTGGPSELDEGPGQLPSPAVADGIVFAPASGGLLHAVDAATGAERWRYQTAGERLTTPAVDSGSVFVVSNGEAPDGTAGGWLDVLDAQSGERRVRVEIPAAAEAYPPAIWNGLVFVSGMTDPEEAATDDESNLSAIDAASGEIAWTAESPDGIGAPVLADGVLYVAFYNDSELRAFDAASGELLWSVFTGIVEAEPVVADGLIVVSTYNETLLVLGDAAGAATPSADGAVTDVSGLPECRPTRPNLTVAPSGEPATSLAGTETSPTGASEIMPTDVPAGTAADDETIAAINEVLRRMAECQQRDSLVHSAPSGFFSDDYFRRRAEEGVTIDPSGGGPGVPRNNSGRPVTSVDDVRELADGRIAVLVMQSDERGTLLIFVEQDGLWLIDEHIAVVPVFGQTG